jgi:hypothetical protein
MTSKLKAARGIRRRGRPMLGEEKKEFTTLSISKTWAERIDQQLSHPTLINNSFVYRCSRTAFVEHLLEAYFKKLDAATAEKNRPYAPPISEDLQFIECFFGFFNVACGLREGFEEFPQMLREELKKVGQIAPINEPQREARSLARAVLGVESELSDIWLSLFFFTMSHYIRHSAMGHRVLLQCKNYVGKKLEMDVDDDLGRVLISGVERKLSADDLRKRVGDDFRVKLLLLKQSKKAKFEKVISGYFSAVSKTNYELLSNAKAWVENPMNRELVEPLLPLFEFYEKLNGGVANLFHGQTQRGRPTEGDCYIGCCFSCLRVFKKAREKQVSCSKKCYNRMTRRLELLREKIRKSTGIGPFLEGLKDVLKLKD